MESEEYKEMSEIVTRQINNRKDELNKAIQHKKKNSIGKPTKDIECNDCLEQNVEPTNLFCGQAKLDIRGKLFFLTIFVKDRFLFTGMLMKKLIRKFFLMEILLIVNMNIGSR